MAVVTETEIVTRAEEIKNETNTGANTATRVGSWMRDSWDTMLDKMGSVVSGTAFTTAISAINTALGLKADTADLANYVPISQKGVANGVAALDENSIVPEINLPVYNLNKVTSTNAQAVSGLGNLARSINGIFVGTSSNNCVGLGTLSGIPSIFFRKFTGVSGAPGTQRTATLSCEVNNSQNVSLPPTSGTLALTSDLLTLQTQIDNINTLLQSNDVNLDNVQELVDAIKTVQTSLATILVDDLTTGGVTKALTAEQGVVLKGLIDAIVPQPPLVNVDDANFQLKDEVNILSLDWNYRQLLNTNGNPIIDWGSNRINRINDLGNAVQFILLNAYPQIIFRDSIIQDNENGGLQITDIATTLLVNFKNGSIGLNEETTGNNSITFGQSSSFSQGANTLFVEGGALKFKGGSGTVTTIATA